MSGSLYKVTNDLGSDVIYNYFDLNSASSISTSYNETNTDNTKLKSASVLNANLKHVNEIGYKISNVDIASSYVPKCFVYEGPQTNIAISVPILTKRIVFLLQAPGGYGHGGSNSPTNPGGDGGSGSLAWGYIDRSLNFVTNITLNLNSVPGPDTNDAIDYNDSTIVFTGGTSVTLTCQSGQSGQNTNDNGVGGGTPTYSNETGVTKLINVAGNAGNNQGNANTYKTSPYQQYPVGNVFAQNASTVYYPLKVYNANNLNQTYGAGGPGDIAGNTGFFSGIRGIASIWFLI